VGGGVGDGVDDSAVADPDGLWRTSLTHVLTEVDSPVQRRWLESTIPVGFSDATLVIASPHGFARDWLERSCGALLRATLSDVAGSPIDLVITVQTPAQAPATGPRPNGEELLAHAAAARTELARAHAVQLAEDHLAQHAAPATILAEVSAGAATAASSSASTSEMAAGTVDDTADVAFLAALRAERAAGAEREFDALAALDHLDVNPLYDRAAYDETPGPSHGTSSGTPLQAPGRPAGPMVILPDATSRLRSADVEPDTRLNPRYSFDDFVIGASNRFAHAAANAVAEQPAKSYNPLFVYGGAGLGKTHLLHAIGHYVRKLYPRLRVRYVTTEQFTNEFINAIRDDSITAFQRLYRLTDVLLVDDVQFLQSKERTQEEFFHTFNALHNAEKQIVLSSDRPPKQIGQLEDRLRSRFEWGLMTDIQPPDLETRIAILRKKAESDRLGVGDEVLEIIATKVASNIRELEGALIRVSAFASLQRAPADAAMAEYVLKDLYPDGRDRIISVQDIIDEVAAYFSITPTELCSASRSRQLVNARQIAMYLTRELTDLSLPRIGRAFGNRDHSTVMHATQKITVLMTERRAVYDQVQELTNRVTSQTRRTR
jgi:chromosomal replication initiator protein